MDGVRQALRLRAGAALASIIVVLVAVSSPAAAETAGNYATWTSSGASGAWSGTAEVAAAGFPATVLTSTSSTLQIPSGNSAFLGPATPFGAVFGSSRGHPYVTIATAAGLAPSTTTLAFAGPTPAAGWGFALGDIDADSMRVTATGPGGPLAAAELGWQGAFNYCAVAPKPGSCTGPGPFTDVPVWDPATSTLTGNGPDTLGAAGWFRPSSPISTLTLTFTRQSGSPIAQLWLAALSVALTGEVAGITPAAPAPDPGVAIDLEHTDGTPVRDPGGDPVRTTVDDTGAFSLAQVTDGDYLLHLDLPAGVSNTGAQNVPVTIDTSAGDLLVPPGTFAVRVRPAPTRSQPSTTRPSPTRPAPASSAPSGTALANTGATTTPMLALSGLLLLVGAVLLRVGRRSRH